MKEFTTGIPRTGEAEVTGLWPKKFKPASLTAADLATVADAQRPMLTYRSFEFMDEDILTAVWTQTLKEVAAGELILPLELAQVPSAYLLSKRFGIRQSSKIRCVDDFTQSCINACAQS